jgi:anti-sigma B factor antagonist
MPEREKGQKEYSVFAMPQELDLYNAETLKKKLALFIESQKTTVIFDCSQLSYIDSSGIGVLVYVHTRLRRQRTVFCFAGLQNHVAGVIKLTGLDGVFPIEDNLDDAVLYVKRSMKP